MLYSKVRDEIKNGDLLVWSNYKLIQVVSGSSYSHVGLALWIGKRLFVLEADVPEIRLYPLSRKHNFYTIRDVAPLWNDEVTNYALDFIGVRYSYWAAIKSYFMPLKVDGNWQCVEYAKFIYRKMGIELNDKYLPSDLVEELLEKGFNIDYVENDLYQGRIKPNTNVFADFKAK